MTVAVELTYERIFFRAYRRNRPAAHIDIAVQRKISLIKTVIETLAPIEITEILQPGKVI